MNVAEGQYIDLKGWSAEQFGRLTNPDRRYFDWHVRRALAGAPCSTVLEIGFGNGAFLSYCRLRGWQATGIEIEPQLCERAQQGGFATANKIDELPADMRFDLIALFDVLEHIPAEELIPFVKSVEARLTTKGAILIRVPNGDSPFGRVYQHGDLTHVTTFGHLKVEQLAKLCNLKLTAKGEAPWHAQQQESRTTHAFLRAVTRSMLSRVFSFAYYGFKVDLSANLVAVLRHR